MKKIIEKEGHLRSCSGTLAESLPVAFVILFQNISFKGKLYNLNSFYVGINTQRT